MSADSAPRDGCLICGAPLEYLTEDVPMTCALCGKKELSRTRCVNGHYVCNDCHRHGVDAIVGACLAAQSDDPFAILEQLMHMDFCHMHGPEHHIMVGAALLTASHRVCNRPDDLERALTEMLRRGREVPGGACGFWGACGAGISTGIAVSILTGSTPLETEAFGLCNRMTAAALERIGTVGGPRCCKRDSFLSLEAAVGFFEQQLGIRLGRHTPVCSFFPRNPQCLGVRCPFFPRPAHDA